MAKYRVWMTANVTLMFEVEAESEAEANEKAEAAWEMTSDSNIGNCIHGIDHREIDVTEKV